MKKLSRPGFLALSLFCVLACGGCTQSEESPGTVACDQACVDQNVSYTLINVIVDLYNQNLAGRPVGVQDLSGLCALGGTAHITGTTGVDSGNGITTVNLSYALSGCHAQAGGDLVFEGTVSEVGSFDGQDYVSENLSSGSLAMSGTVQGTAIDETCEVHVNRNANAVSGNICGRTF